jgi:hypothetical protein
MTQSTCAQQQSFQVRTIRSARPHCQHGVPDGPYQVTSQRAHRQYMSHMRRVSGVCVPILHCQGIAFRVMARKPKLGSGARFRALRKKGVSPALAAYIGRKKYGKKRMAKLSAKGRRRAARRRKR